jgi:hypothetical protein
MFGMLGERVAFLRRNLKKNPSLIFFRLIQAGERGGGSALPGAAKAGIFFLESALVFSSSLNTS